MSRSLLVLSLATSMLLAGCNSEAPPSAQKPAAAPAAAQPPAPNFDEQFADLSKRWLDGSFKLSPVSATQAGDHRFDAELDDLSAEGRQRGLDFSKGMLAELGKIDRTKLSRENQIDYAILSNQVKSDIWYVESLQGWAWDPTIYSQIAGGALYTLMAREFAPLPIACARRHRAWRSCRSSSSRCTRISIRTVCRRSTPTPSPSRTRAC